MPEVKEKTKKRLGILRGGAGEEYNSSLRKGGDFILHITENLGDQYKVYDILIDRDYVWHLGGVPINPGDLVTKIDVVWNFSHPSFSNILESLGIPNIGASAFSHSLKTSREMLAEHMKSMNVSIPRHIVLPVYQKDFDPRYAKGSGEASGPREKYSIKKAKEVFEKFSSPWIVKSFTPDTSMAIHLAKTFPELVRAIEDGVEHEKSILVEEFIAGKVASIHSVPNFRNEEVYVFPLGNSFGIFSHDEKEKLISLTKDLHTHLGAEHYLQSQFILTPRGKVYLSDFDLNPDIKPDSHFSQVCESVGAKPHDVILHILEGAM